MKKTLISTFTPLIESAGGIKAAPGEAGGRVFKGVTLIKAGLGNRRDRNFYPPETLKAATESGMFEGLRAYADHPTAVDEEIQPERTIRDMVGLYDNSRFVKEGDGGRVVANFRVLKSHKWLADTIEELVQLGHGDKLGISINGRGETEPHQLMQESGEAVDVNRVVRFVGLRSADVVTEAGAGGGFMQLLESAKSAAIEARCHSG